MRRSLVSVAVAASAALVLASCAMPADDPNFNASGGAFGSEAAAEEQAATDATGAVEAALAAPTSIGVDAPLAAAPAAGSLIVSLSDGTAWNTLLNASMAEAAAAIGWEFQEVAGAETVESVPAAFEEALALEPAGIRISGEHVEALATQLAAAEAAGVPVICTGCSGEPAGAIKDTSIDGDAQNAEWGKLLAEYVFTNQAEGEDAGVEMFTLPGARDHDLQPRVRAAASRPVPRVLDQRDVRSTPPTSDPLVPTFIGDTMSTSLGRWALLDSGAVAEGVAQALAEALVLEPVVLIGRGAAAPDIAALQELAAAGVTAPGAEAASGAASAEASPEASPETTEEAGVDAGGEALTDGSFATPEEAAALQAWTALPVPVMGWRVVDQFARIIGGDPLAAGPLPSQLITVGQRGRRRPRRERQLHRHRRLQGPVRRPVGRAVARRERRGPRSADRGPRASLRVLVAVELQADFSFSGGGQERVPSRGAHP